MSGKDFSVLICTYYKDDPILLSLALKSIFSNSLKVKLVLLVQDGNLTNALNNVIKKFKSKHNFITYKLDKNYGLSHALNFGISKIKTEWIIRADADDFNSKDRFLKIRNAIYENKKIDIIGSNVKELGSKSVFVKKVPSSYMDIKSYILFRNPFNHMSVAFKRSVINSCGGYPHIRFLEDYALWVKLIGTGYYAVNLRSNLVNVSAGTSMYKRRSNFSKIISEFHLMKLKKEYLRENSVLIFFIFIIRVTFIFSPVFFVKYIYEHFLRTKE